MTAPRGLRLAHALCAAAALAAAEQVPLRADGSISVVRPPVTTTSPPPSAAGKSKRHYIAPRELSSIIVADLAPHGMLPLAWAASAGGGTGWVPATALVATFASAAAYTLYLSARLADGGPRRAAPALSQLWRTAKLPLPRAVDYTVALLCAGCCVFYAAFAADLFHALAGPVLGWSRPAVLAALTCLPLTPLCLGDDLSALKYSSLAGLAGVLYSSLFVVRAGVLSPHALPTWRVGPGTLVLANTLVVAFLCHYNAVQYYRELAPRRRTPRVYLNAVGSGAAATALVFSCTLFGGAAAFGSEAMPNVLSNFGGGVGPTLARLGVGVAILSGFPLMFAGLKAALDGAAPGWCASKPRRRATHATLLAAVAAIAANASEDDVGLIIEVLGSTLGVAAAYVVPGICAARATRLERGHRVAGGLLAGAGGLLCVGGTAITLRSHSHAVAA